MSEVQELERRIEGLHKLLDERGKEICRLSAENDRLRNELDKKVETLAELQSGGQFFLH